MTEAQSHNSENNDNTLKEDERDLVLDEVAIVTVLELDNTEDASDEDEDDGGAEAT